MNRFFFLIIITSLLFCSCSSDEDKDNQIEQDYTSFTFMHNSDLTLPECVIGYYQDGLCKKIAELGDLIKGQESKEIRVDDDFITEVFFFTNYAPIDIGLTVKKMDATYKLEKNKKNRFIIDPNTNVIRVEKNNPTEYPH